MILSDDFDTQIRVRNMVKTMLQLQDRMNTKVHPDWRNQNYPWYRAAWIEVAELMDHYGWKWWKKQEPDLAQARMEVIDILHFCLSDYMQIWNIDNAAAHLQSAANEAYSPIMIASGSNDVLLNAECLAASFLTEQEVPSRELFELAISLGMSFDDLFLGYVGKNVLNMFRQEHGYKEGTYQKIWDGREDNEHLVAIARSLDSSSPDFPQQLQAALAARYAELCGVTA